MNEEQPKRKRGRPPGSPNKNGTPVGRPKGSGLAPRETVTLASGKQREMVLPQKDNAAVPSFGMACLEISKTVDREDPQTLYHAFEMYLQLCASTGMKVSNAFAHLALGVSDQIMSDWRLGNRRQNNPAYREFAMFVKQFCAAAREQYGIEGATNPILTIFHQKYYDGFVDNPGAESYADPLGEIQDPQKLAEKYKDIITD